MRLLLLTVPLQNQTDVENYAFCMKIFSLIEQLVAQEMLKTFYVCVCVCSVCVVCVCVCVCVCVHIEGMPGYLI